MLVQMISFSKQRNKSLLHALNHHTSSNAAFARFDASSVRQYSNASAMPDLTEQLFGTRCWPAAPSAAGTRPSDSSSVRRRRLLVGPREGVITTAPRDIRQLGRLGGAAPMVIAITRRQACGGARGRCPLTRSY